jgi:flagellar biosynthesis GTPase FlhF
MKKGAGGRGQGAEGTGEAEPADGDIDALFKLAPPEFVAARNALAARFKKAGRPDAANRVKALPKPSISAWTVNQVYWRHRIEFDKLLATGERFRRAQASRLTGSGPDIRGLLNERREVLSEISRLAAAILQKSGGSSPAGVMRRVTATLEAISAYGSLPGAPRAGHLVEDVDPPGFEALAALVPRVGDATPIEAPSRVLAFQKEAPAASRKAKSRQDTRRNEQQRQAQLAAARAARQKAERALADARKLVETSQAVLKKAATLAKETEKDMVAAEQRLQKAASTAHEARQRARRAAVEAETAAQAAEEAEVTLDRAKRDLDRLENS